MADDLAPTGAFQYVADSGQPIVSMVVFQNRLLVATSSAIYELLDKKLVPIEFKHIPSPVRS